MKRVRFWSLTLFLVAFQAAIPRPVAFADTVPTALTASAQRGRALFISHCSMCHQVTGKGSGTTYPPLVSSSYLQNDTKAGIRAIVAGLSGKISVNGQSFDGKMPAALLTDVQVADVMNYVLNAFNSGGEEVTPSVVQDVRANSPFPTYEKLVAAAQFRPLPQAPTGFETTELAQLPDFATRLAGDRKGRRLYVLGQQGTVWCLEIATRKFTPILLPSELSEGPSSDCSTLGLTLDVSNRLWMTVNHRINGTPWASNQVSIYRTTAIDAEGHPVHPQLWFRTSYPYGVGPYNHGVSELRFGSDGLLYVSSGSRTDGGEAGNDPSLGKMGETEITSALWRLDPRSDSPQIEVIARGIRNAYSFNWDGNGNLFTVSNGPDAPAAEEMDMITLPQPGEAPEHHGFPYQFADAPESKKWYAHTPAALPGQKFVLPVLNLGPDGLLDGDPTSTFTPHSSPAGLAWVGKGWPEPYRDVFLMGRFGNLIRAVHDQDVGFDVLALHLERRHDGRWTARSQTFLRPLGRPIDLHFTENGHLYVLEYTRATDFKSQAGWLPGRILDVHPASKTAER